MFGELALHAWLNNNETQDVRLLLQPDASFHQPNHLLLLFLPLPLPLPLHPILSNHLPLKSKPKPSHDFRHSLRYNLHPPGRGSGWPCSVVPLSVYKGVRYNELRRGSF